MGYCIYDVDGFVADGPNISGWKELRDDVLLPQGGDATREFVQEGATTQLEALRLDLSKMKAKTTSAASTLAALVKAADRCLMVIILSTGVAGDGPDDPDELEEGKVYLA